jgi:glucose uptake protein GlcU
MSTTKSRVAAAAVFLVVGTEFAALVLPDHVARIVLGVVCGVVLFAGIVLVAWWDHLRLNEPEDAPEDAPSVREVPTSNGLQVLGTFLSDGEGGGDR